MQTEIDVPDVSMRAIRDKLEREPGVVFKARGLAQAAGLPTKGTQVETRNAILRLITHEQCPIVSRRDGFMWAENIAQVRRYINELEERRLGIHQRITALRRVIEDGLVRETLPNTPNCAGCGRELQIPNPGWCDFCLMEKNIERDKECTKN